MSEFTVDSVFNVLGGPAKAARRLGVARTTVLGWRKVGIPAARVLDVHDATGIDIDKLRKLAANRLQSAAIVNGKLGPKRTGIIP